MPVDPTDSPEREPLLNLADDEVAFWRSFVEWWAREREVPVPPRAWDALARADAKWRALDVETGPAPASVTNGASSRAN